LYRLTFEELVIIAAEWKVEPINCLEFYAASYEFPGLAHKTAKARQMILDNRAAALAHPNSKTAIEGIRMNERESIVAVRFICSVGGEGM